MLMLYSGQCQMIPASDYLLVAEIILVLKSVTKLLFKPAGISHSGSPLPLCDFPKHLEMRTLELETNLCLGWGSSCQAWGDAGSFFSPSSRAARPRGVLRRRADLLFLHWRNDAWPATVRRWHSEGYRGSGSVHTNRTLRAKTLSVLKSNPNHGCWRLLS